MWDLLGHLLLPPRPHMLLHDEEEALLKLPGYHSLATTTTATTVCSSYSEVTCSLVCSAQG